MSTKRINVGRINKKIKAKQKKAKARAEILSKTKAFAFQEQCFLALARQEIYMKLNALRLPKNGPSPLENEHVNSVYASREESSTLINTISALDGAQQFFNLDSSILSQLKPIVEIHKVFPDLKFPETKGRAFSVQLPLGEQIKLSADGGSTISSGALFGGSDMPQDAASIEENIFRQHNILGNAMLTDLSFKQTGQNVALLNTLEDVNFTIHFSSPSVFFHVFEEKYRHPDSSADSKRISYSFVDLISFTSKYKQEGADNPVSFNTRPSRRKCSDNNTILRDIEYVHDKLASEKHFEIRLVVRYDPEDINWDMVKLAGDRNEIHHQINREALKNFLRNSPIIMRLQLKSHTINYSGNSGPADPNLSINFNYAAYLENSFLGNDLDLFANSNSDVQNVTAVLNNLHEVRKLITRIQEENIGFQEAFGGTKDPAFIEQYMKSRDMVDDRLGDVISWMIFHPEPHTNRNRPSALPSKIVPARNKAYVAEQARENDIDLNESGTHAYENVNAGMYKGQDAGDGPAKGQDAMLRVFKELENNLVTTLRFLRRQNVSQTYGDFFTKLYEKNRMYRALVEPKKLGVDKWGSSNNRLELELNPEEEMAEKRKTNHSLNTLGETKIHLMGPGVTDGPGAESNPYKADEKVIKKMNAKNAEAQDVEFEVLSPKLYSNRRRGAAIPKLLDGSVLVYFTTLGDVLDQAISLATGDEGIYHRSIGIILGPLADRSDEPTTAAGIPMSLADIPISLRTLMGFWIKNVVASDRLSYPLGDFVKHVIADLILPSLGSRCTDGSDGIEPDYTLGVLSFTSEIVDGKAPFYPHNLKSPSGGVGRSMLKGNKFYDFNDTEKTLPWFNNRGAHNLTHISPTLPLENQFNYMLIFINNFSADFTNPLEEQKNIKNGIYYLHTAKLPSPLLQSKFSRENIKYLREARVQGQLTRTGGLGLRDVYRFGCTMYGNNIFQPGMKVFVDPTRDGANYEKWTALGMGGFYTVVGVTHSVLNGDSVMHTTSLDCKWDSFGCLDNTNQADAPPSWEELGF